MAAKKSESGSTKKRGRAKSDVVPTMLRMRQDLRDRIEASARRNGNSMNEEMVMRLEVSYMRDQLEARDTILVELLTGNRGPTGDLLRDLVIELQKRPHWNLSKEDQAELINCVAFNVLRNGLREDLMKYENFDDFLRRRSVKNDEDAEQ